MDLQTLLMIDIGVIVAIPIAILFFHTMIGIITVCILTSVLIYLDSLIFKTIHQDDINIVKK